MRPPLKVLVLHLLFRKAHFFLSPRLRGFEIGEELRGDELPADTLDGDAKLTIVLFLVMRGSTLAAIVHFIPGFLVVKTESVRI